MSPRDDQSALQQRYQEERDKRIKNSAARSVQGLEGEFAGYLHDPFADTGFVRDPLHKEFDVVIVGGGIAGLLTAARLTQAGISRVCIVEKGADFGGAWYWNRYPGIACDTESYIYLPLLEETGYMPTRKYASGLEILAYCRKVARHFALYDNALLQTEFKGAQWQEDTSRWIVRTDRQDVLSARFVVLIGNKLHRPQLPAIPGIKSFKGHSFHTSRWDYNYTGGDSRGGLTGLSDKRIGIIGTGATAVQCVPHLARWAKHLYVFQRTPAPVDVRNDRETDPQWAKSLKPGWQQERMDNFTAVVSGYDVDQDLVCDGWTDLARNVKLAAVRKLRAGEVIPDPDAVVQAADDERMNRIRARIDATVRDKSTAESLKPWYRQACKRPGFHDQYLDTFNQPNVTLVDTRGKGIESITTNAVVVDGKEYAVDCLVFATGFEYNSDFTRILGADIEGRGGLSLSRKWQDGAETFHGIASTGFPNAFFIGGMQIGYSPNFTHMLDISARQIASVIAQARLRNATTVEPTQEAENEWVELIVKLSQAKEAVLRECTPGYINNEGVLDLRARKNRLYGGDTVSFLTRMDAWQKDGTFKGLRFV